MLLLPSRFSILVGLATLLTLSGSSAQTISRPPILPHATTLPDATDNEQFVAYWTTETGWHSELQLRNNLIGSDLTVTPVLRTAYGAEATLSAVTIRPQEVKAIDLDAAIGTTAPQLVGTYGSAVLRYRSLDSANLYASLMIHNIGHPIAFHIDAMGESQDLQAGSREGIWWLPKDTTSDYLILTNQGKNTIPLDLSLYDANGKEAKQKLALGPRETTRYSIRKLIQAAGLSGSYGGIKVSAPAHAGSLDTVHFLFDQTAAFSAILKMFDYDPNAQIKERDYAKTGVWTLRAPMLALSNPDPALAFPAGTTLRPQLFIRNTIGKPVDAALRFSWRAGSTTGAAAGPALRLNPFETRRIDVTALQQGAVPPKEANWTSVTLTTKALPDEVMAVAASYDDTLRYGAQTPFSDQLSSGWEGSSWEYDPYHDSIITAGNGGTKPTKAAFTIFYNQGTEKYELEQTIQPDEQMWIDVGKLIREHLPDKNGKTLPEDLTSGSYEIRDLTNTRIGTLFEGKVVYDKTYGHVTYGCGSCCDGYSYVHLMLNPLAIPLGAAAGNGVNARYVCTGVIEDVSDAFYNNWRSANTGIATVDYYGTFTGKFLGSTTSSTSGNLSMKGRLDCPIGTFYPGGSDNVTPPPALSCSPASVTRASSVTCSVSNASTFSNWKFKDSNNNTVTSGSTNSSWSGVMVTSGTVSVLVSGSTTLSATVTVNNRNWHTNPASAAEVPNSTFITLPVPPQPGTDSGLGYFKWTASYNGPSYSTINDGGPNQGYTYWPSNLSYSVFNFQYEINPDLENTTSTFYQAQCGNYNSTTNPNGFIPGSNLLTQTNRHEWNSSTQSHHAFYSNSLNSSADNPGDYLEQQVAPPGANLSTFVTNTQSGINSRFSAVQSASQVEPFPVNDSEIGTFLGNINYAPYTACH